jgi:alkanesulfonate monooxygenase SsuD/methylene tetrahydromethanopterin reductase-like flavin-dependent oxidoreductase (luciferase family)
VSQPSFGIILANRAVVLGAVKVRDLLDLAATADEAGVFDTVWVGDSLLAKPRLEAVSPRSSTVIPCSSPTSGRAST